MDESLSSRIDSDEVKAFRFARWILHVHKGSIPAADKKRNSRASWHTKLAMPSPGIRLRSRTKANLLQYGALGSSLSLTDLLLESKRQFAGASSRVGEMRKASRMRRRVGVIPSPRSRIYGLTIVRSASSRSGDGRVNAYQETVH